MSLEVAKLSAAVTSSTGSASIQPKFCVAAFPEDTFALRVYLALEAQLGPEQAHLLSGAELAMLPRITHTVDNTRATVDLELANNRTLALRPGSLVLNRLTRVCTPQFDGASLHDREYAMLETYALWLSVLESLPCRVVNRPDAQALCGRNVSRIEVLLLASRAGLPVQGYMATTDSRRWFRPDFDAHPIGISEVQAVAMNVSIPRGLVGRSACLFLEPVEAPPHTTLVTGASVFGYLAQTYTRELIELRSMLRLDVMEAVFMHSMLDGRPKLCSVTAIPGNCDTAYLNHLSTWLMEQVA